MDKMDCEKLERYFNQIPGLMMIDTVSYTHLDVYKRQTGNWACITNVLRMNISYNNFDMLEIGYGINLRPVSYTHLDVYKRQGRGKPSVDLGSAVVVGQYLFIVVSFFRHPVGSVLAHADTVAGAVGCECYGIAGDVYGEIGGGQIQRFTYLSSCQSRITYCLLYTSIEETGFGNIRLIQDTDGFCYGIDAVILADFTCRIRPDFKMAVDLGSGNGIIPFILSHKNKDARFIGVEVQEAAVRLAEKSCALNCLQSRISFVNGDVSSLNRMVYEKMCIRDSLLRFPSTASLEQG